MKIRSFNTQTSCCSVGMLLKRNLKTPPRSSFDILRPPIFHPKQIEGPPISPPPPPSNLNCDWSLSHHCHFKYVLKTRGGWLGEHLRWPEPIYMRVGYVFSRVFRQEWSSIKNGRTLRKCYLFSYRHKNIWDIDICLKPHLYKKVNNFKSLRQIFL